VANLVRQWRLLRARWAALRHPRLTIGAGTQLSGRLVIGGKGRVTIGPRCEVKSATLWAIAADSVVTVGADCYLNGPEVAARQSVRIGERCEIGSALIYDTDFHSLQRVPRGSVQSAPIVIEDDVWLAARTAVLRGVRIGARSVVGMGVVVAGSVDADTLLRVAEPRRRRLE
jgi:acetyltransferase-like isoleucine patch superfamily enzyme